jgi:hypothetical protein
VVRSGTVRPGDPVELIPTADGHAHVLGGQPAT